MLNRSPSLKLKYRSFKMCLTQTTNLTACPLSWLVLWPVLYFLGLRSKIASNFKIKIIWKTCCRKRILKFKDVIFYSLRLSNWSTLTLWLDDHTKYVYIHCRMVAMFSRGQQIGMWYKYSAHYLPSGRSDSGLLRYHDTTKSVSSTSPEH